MPIHITHMTNSDYSYYPHDHPLPNIPHLVGMPTMITICMFEYSIVHRSPFSFNYELVLPPGVGPVRPELR